MRLESNVWHKKLKELPNRWQIGCRQGFGTELPSLVSTEFLTMCKQHQRPAAILSADLKGAFFHALLVQVVGPYISEKNLRDYFPSWSEEDRREHVRRAVANPLRVAGLSKTWTDLPLGQEEIFLSSPAERAVSLDGLTFVDDDTVLLCGDSRAQLIEKMWKPHASMSKRPGNLV